MAIQYVAGIYKVFRKFAENKSLWDKFLNSSGFLPPGTRLIMTDSAQRSEKASVKLNQMQFRRSTLQKMKLHAEK